MDTPNSEPSPSPASANRSGRKRLELDGKKTMAIALAGTAALSAVATAREGDLTGFAQAAKNVLTGTPNKIDVDANRTDTHFGVTDPLSLKVNLSEAGPKFIKTTKDEQVVEINHDIGHADMPWALEFSQDPEAQNTNLAEAEIQSVASQIEDYKKHGYEVKSVSVKGFASDEDNDPGGGLGKPSPLNKELAKTRADAVEKELAKDMRAADITDAIKNLGGREIIDPKLDHRIEQLAGARHMTVLELVQKYNRDRAAFSKADLEILDGLADDRFVKVVAVLEKDELVEVPIVSASSQEKHGSVIIVPFLIPIFRRRKVGKGAAALEQQRLREARIVPEYPLETQVRRRGMHSSTAHVRKQPRPHNYHGSRMSNKGHNSRGRGARATGGHKF